MKLVRLVSSAPLLLIAAMVSAQPTGNPAVPAVAPKPSKEVPLIDFTDIRRDRSGKIELRPYQYAFGDWDRHVIDLPDRGVLIQATSGNGGLGENKPQGDFRGATALVLYFSIGNANRAQSIALAVKDADDTEYVWNIRLARRPPGQPLRLRLHLEKPDTVQTPGKTPGLDLKHIASWQIHGDWQGAATEALLIRLAAEKEK
jgi:hypothetical protein